MNPKPQAIAALAALALATGVGAVIGLVPSEEGGEVSVSVQPDAAYVILDGGQPGQVFDSSTGIYYWSAEEIP